MARFKVFEIPVWQNGGSTVYTVQYIYSVDSAGHGEMYRGVTQKYTLDQFLKVHFSTLEEINSLG